MKLPALWLASAFAAGIALALRWPGELRTWLVIALATILAGGILAWRNRVAAAWVLVLVAWMALGGLASGIERASVPSNHVDRLIAAGRLDFDQPLRWRGRLREDPLSLPWGRRYEINLEQVEIAGSYVPVSGGLRANLYDGPQAGGVPRGLRAGDRIEVLMKARPPRDFLDPGAFDVRGYLARQKIDLTGSLRSGELLQLIDRPPPTFLQRVARVRGDLLARLDALFPGQPQRAAVLRAMLLGDRSFVDSQIVTAFQITAAYHVLVVAGLHVGALTIFLFWLCRKFRLSIAATSFITLAVLAAYVGLVQDRPPILRAALMAALYLCARPLFRRIDLLNIVSLAALVLLMWKPDEVADSSFQLSFLAAGVIAALALPWMERSTAPYRAGLRHLGDVTRDGAHPPKVVQFRIEMRAATAYFASRMPRRLAAHASAFITAPVRVGLRLWEVVLLSLVIQWGMMPLLAQDFHRVSLAGPISNIPAVLLTGLIVPLGFLTLVVTFVWSGLAILLAKALGLCTAALLGSVEWFSKIPRVSYRIPGPPVWLLLAFFAALILLAYSARAAATRRATRAAKRLMPPPIAIAEWTSAIFLAALTVLVASYPFAPNLDRGKLGVTVLDVGQGDSIFAEFPGGRTMLIDGGGLSGSEWVGGYRSGIDVGEEVVSPYLWSRGLKRIDVVALSHADHDHIDGLYSVLQNFKVGQLWVGWDDPRPAFARLLAEARARGIRIVHVDQGEDFNFGVARADVLWPPAGGTGESPNDNCVVLRLSDGPSHFLLTGDIERPAEEGLLADHQSLESEFLKVPHHGSKTSSTAAFLAAVDAQVAVVSVGAANPFGHPAPPVVQRYEQDGVRLLRTDRDGAVTAIANGKTLLVSTYTSQQPAEPAQFSSARSALW
ncbi:MAG TPA: ComEC/Rec2 family competence protein [Candidatus Dormibacteraeota bacterium]|nr:ComEC/Rec2 family competence protein [Candidatus Dormibacteraeota bacterium]